MNVREAAAALGGEASGAQGVLCPGPGHGPHDRSLSVRFTPGAPAGFVVHSFAGDDWQACRDHVRHILGLGDWRGRRDDMPAPRPRPKRAPADDDDAGRIAKALAIWGEGRDPRGSVVERYLGGRHLVLEDHRCGRVIRYHPRLFIPRNLRTAPEHAEPGPGMVCIMRDLSTDRPVGIHRTFLTPDGQKRIRERAMLGRNRHAAIKLDPDDRVELGLVVGEGLETCMAARQLGYRPIWALGSAGAIGSLPPIPGIEGLTLLGENDASCANARACECCARRWLAAARATVAVVEPADPGINDLNDLLRERAVR